jgi:Ser/Thr protein kinase RdoA (MazF antagonist)
MREEVMSALSVVPWVPHPSRIFRYVHSRFRKLDVERETVDAVLREYGLQVTRRPRNLPMGWRNHCVVVDTDAGRKVLKQYRPQWNLGAVLCEHSILKRLAQLDIAATRVVATSKGRTCVVRPGGIFALFDFIEGSTYSLTLIPSSHRQELVGLAGRGLARIHRHLCGFVPDGKHHLGFRSYEGSRQRPSGWYAERVSDLVERTRQLPTGQAKEMASRWSTSCCASTACSRGRLARRWPGCCPWGSTSGSGAWCSRWWRDSGGSAAPRPSRSRCW